MKPFEKWIEEVASLTCPKEIHICDGSEEEAVWMIKKGMEEERINGNPVFYELNQKTWPTAYLHRSHPTDVARTEHLTFVCHPEKDLAGPNNNWMDPVEAKQILTRLSKGCMRGRTMYVLPYAMGNLDSPFCKLCIQVTDISYVAVSMRIMTHMGKDVLEKIGNRDDFVKGIHSIGDLDPTRRYIMHFPQENLVWSIGSGYGGNALLGKKCFSLRIASWLGFKEGWLAEHMLMIGVEDPEGKIYYICGAFPSACGKTNLALLESPLAGYKVWTLGDDIAWLRIGEDGRLYAMNPETGYFGVAPGTSWKTNPNMMRTLKAAKFFPTLFTNVALAPDTNEPFWEGLGEFPQKLLDWQGNPWDPSKPFAAHPNSRFTVSIFNTPTLSPEFFNPKGVPVSAIIVGVRRSDTIPLVVEAFDWKHGVFLGARMGSEITAAAQDLKTGTVRRDPFAMLPFCGYNMADYFAHWLDIGKKIKHPPKIFAVNWFRKSQDGRYLWPGFGENIRILKWIIDRVNGKVEARETPIGLVPYPKDILTEGLDLEEKALEEALRVDKKEWQKEVEEIKNFFSLFGERLPFELHEELRKLEDKIKKL
ncbi:MAG: phosphoenolpyruvate carboxykinase (GTP) [candidate division WOR-3 bacterium]